MFAQGENVSAVPPVFRVWLCTLSVLILSLIHILSERYIVCLLSRAVSIYDKSLTEDAKLLFDGTFVIFKYDR